MNDFKVRQVSEKQKDLEKFISEKITELVQEIDFNRNFKNGHLQFNDSVGNFDTTFPQDEDQVNNFSIEIEMNENGRMKHVVIEMAFNYEKI